MIGLILAAAGTGSRFGSEIPKQFTELQGRPLYLHALEAFLPLCAQVVVVLPESWKEEVERRLRAFGVDGRLTIESGGAERQDSVERGLLRLGPEIETVLVHDAARPFCTPELIQRVVEGTRRHGACIPALPVPDTIKEVSQEKVVRTLDRSTLRLIQTPQGFRRRLLIDAFRAARESGFFGTDEASLVERLGTPVHVVEGEAANVKITWKEDL